MTVEIVPTLVFAATVFGTVIGIVLLSGFLPASVMPRGWWTACRIALLSLDSALVVGLIAALTHLAVVQLPWTTAVIAAGLAVLAAPPLFQLLPQSLRNAPAGLVAFVPLAVTLLIVTLVA